MQPIELLFVLTIYIFLKIYLLEREGEDFQADSTLSEQPH